MLRDDDYPGESADREARERLSDGIATIFVMGWWLIPIGIYWAIDWVKSLI